MNIEKLKQRRESCSDLSNLLHKKFYKLSAEHPNLKLRADAIAMAGIDAIEAESTDDDELAVLEIAITNLTQVLMQTLTDAYDEQITEDEK